MAKADRLKPIAGAGLPIREGLLECLLIAILTLAATPVHAARQYERTSETATPPPPTIAPAREAEEAAFREGLRQRGLDAWLDAYLAETPPVSGVDEQLRHREALLAQAALSGTPRRQRQQLVAEASGILSALIDKYAEHPARTRWRLELARDKLEREDPAAFDAVLLYELPGRDRAVAARLSTAAITELNALRADVAGAWEAFAALDERAMAKAAAAGETRPLEQLDGQSAFYLAWAQFYQAISADQPAAERDTQLKDLLATVTERYGWTAAIPGHEVQRAGALALACVTLRLTGQFVEADRAARTITEIVSALQDPAARQSLDRAVLLAILEQVRGPRDAGKFDDARAILDEARKWAATSRPGDIQTELALALLERSILARQLTKRTVPPTAPAGASVDAPVSLLMPAEALLPLQRVTGISPAARDAVYEALAGAVSAESLSTQRSPFEVQLIAGASIADALAAAAPTTTRPVSNSRGLEIAKALGATAEHPTTPIPAATRGEMLFLQARAYYLGGAPLEAVRALCDLVEQIPDHDRADTAARQATAVAEEALRSQDQAAARMAFVRAARSLRGRWPDSPEARRLQFMIASVLDEAGRFVEAADEYAAVSADDAQALRAAWGRARCLRDALNAVTATRPADAPDAKTLADRAVSAGRAAAEKAANAPQPDPCLAADITLILANVLNHPAVARYAEAVQVLEGFETRHADCSPALAPALRERVAALRQLKRMGEARAAVEAYLQTDPENAGPLMARLLDAMRAEMAAAADRGDAVNVRGTADEAATLAERLLAWAKAHPGRMSVGDALTVSVWRAWATLEAGRPKEALELYAEAAKAPAELLPRDGALFVEIRLGQAEASLATDAADDALKTFSELLGRLPEHSPNWWRAYAGTLATHTRLKHDPEQIVQSIRQQRKLAPELGGPRWARALQQIEEANVAAAKR